MPRHLRFLFLLVCSFGVAPLALAHEPLESTASITRTDECLEVSAVLSPESALLLLPEDRRPRALLKENLPLHRETFAAAAPRVCSLLDPSGAVITPTGTHITLNRDGELVFLVLYPADAGPSALRMDYLNTQPAGAFCEVTDATADPVAHLTLRKDRLVYTFAASTPATSTTTPRP